jgi:SAM-dependent methyltransferase
MTQGLSRKEFRLMLRAYEPSRYERFGEADPRFKAPMHHAVKSQQRFYAAIRSGLSYLPAAPATILDFGPYPGTLLRLLRRLDAGKRMRLVGAGLMTGTEFVQFMKEDCGADVLTVNLDPAAPQFQAKAYPEKVPLPDGSVHLAFALEIVEHLTNPFHLLSEACRVLRRGGHLVITTPNVTRVGNLFKLIVGRSPNDRLAPPGYANPDDEWRPHAREYAMVELERMLRETGFEVAERRFFLGEDTQDCAKRPKQRLIDTAKVPFYLIPHFRGSLLIVGRKPGNAVRSEE